LPLPSCQRGLSRWQSPSKASSGHDDVAQLAVAAVSVATPPVCQARALLRPNGADHPSHDEQNSMIRRSIA
jgi:hypothetical protein